MCRAWRDFLADPLEWLVLNVEFPDASRRRRMSEAALRGAAGRARGRLRELVLESSLLLNPSEDVTCLIEELVTANGASLRKLRVGRKDLPEGEKPPAFLSRLLSLAPSLAELDARNLSFSVSQETCDVLRGLPPFQTGVVRVPILLLETDPAGDGDVHSVEDMLAVVAAAKAHAPLKGVQIIGYLRPEEVDAFVALAARRKLEEVHFHEGLFAPDSTPVLAGLLQQKSLEILYLCNDDEFDQDAMFDVWGAQLFASALRANCTLKLLTLESPRLFDGALGCSLLIAAATAHPSLAVLTLTIKEPDWDARLIAHPLAALVAANSSVFECLRISCEGLGDEGLRPLALALPQNKHVVVLTCESCGLSEAFMRDCACLRHGYRSLLALTQALYALLQASCLSWLRIPRLWGSWPRRAMTKHFLMSSTSHETRCQRACTMRAHHGGRRRSTRMKWRRSWRKSIVRHPPSPP